MRRFEGKTGDGRRTLFLFEYDSQTQRVHVESVLGPPQVLTLRDVAARLPGHPDLVALIYGLHEGEVATSAWSWQDAIGAGLFSDATIVAPGVSEMMRTRRCERADFSPLNGRVVDLREADLSGVAFGEIDFRPVLLDGAIFAYAIVNRCRFGPRQLAGLDLRHALLAGADLRGLDLSGAQLDGAVLTGADLTGAVLRGCSLRDARLDRVDFSQTDATGAVFDGARGIGTRFVRATLTDASFIGTRLGAAEFAGTTLINTSFKDAILAEARFAAAAGGVAAARFDAVDFDNADLRSADFGGTVLTGCKVPARPPRLGRDTDHRTRFVGAELNSSLLGSDWSYIDATDAAITLDTRFDETPLKAVEAILPGITFAGHTLLDADFTGAELQDARFARCVLRFACFSGAILPGADFTGANLEGANFSDADLRAAVFARAWVFSARFGDAMLVQANFSSAMLAQVDFTGIMDRNMAGVSFAGACLVSALFNNVSAPRLGLARTTFSGACLAGADFTRAVLTDVILSGAQLSDRDGSIEVEHPQRPRPRRFNYTATKLSPEATGPETTCPNGEGGQCSITQLLSVKVPERWTTS